MLRKSVLRVAALFCFLAGQVSASEVNSEVNDGLIRASDGFVYGTAADGHGGVIFKVAADGSGFTRIHNFGDPASGTHPLGGLTEGEDGALYGTASRGGDLSCLPPNGCGVLFRINKDGSNYKVLHRFEAFPDGRYPDGNLVVDGDLIYGRIEIGGDGASDCACGAIYRLHRDGTDYALVHRYNFDTGIGVADIALGAKGVVFRLTERPRG